MLRVKAYCAWPWSSDKSFCCPFTVYTELAVGVLPSKSRQNYVNYSKVLDLFALGGGFAEIEKSVHIEVFFFKVINWTVASKATRSERISPDFS